MLARTLKYYAYRLAPRSASALHRAWRERRASAAPPQRPSPAALQAEAIELSRRARDVEDPARLFDLVCASPGFPPNQNRAEILGLLGLLRGRRPRVLCEIGSAEGGTLFLLAQVAVADARILSIDLHDDAGRSERFAALARPGQTLTCIGGSSHDRETRERFRAWLGDDALDFAFIDGDHSLEGVARDYRYYGSTVRPGGLIAFHDIAPDYRTRFGVDSGTYSGGVPEFWATLDKGPARVHEFVDDARQDGRGIGALLIPLQFEPDGQTRKYPQSKDSDG